MRAIQAYAPAGRIPMPPLDVFRTQIGQNGRRDTLPPDDQE
jgi:hypothetical protein